MPPVEDAVSAPSDRPQRLWQNRSFVLLFGAHVVSLLGSGTTTIGLALFAYKMAGADSATGADSRLLARDVSGNRSRCRAMGDADDVHGRRRRLLARSSLRLAVAPARRTSTSETGRDALS